MQAAKFRLVVGLLASMAINGLAQGAQADIHGNKTVVARVRFDDLDLRNPAGAAMLHWRLRTAAKEVCAQGHPRDLRSAPRRARCLEHALEGALARLPRTVQAYHAAWIEAGRHWLAAPYSAPETGSSAPGVVLSAEISTL
jgi:UrcA family protein